MHVLFLLSTASAALVPGLIMMSPEGELISQNPSILLTVLRPTVIVPLVSITPLYTVYKGIILHDCICLHILYCVSQRYQCLISCRTLANDYSS